uniref:Uncharacterized protein n=1 Tax=viral metagenome TaxID=1070528 RepID=A0A6M3J7C5_9ZZZZ
MALTLNRKDYDYANAGGYFDQYTQTGQDNIGLDMATYIQQSKKDNTTRTLAMIAGGVILLVGITIIAISKRRRK